MSDTITSNIDPHCGDLRTEPRANLEVLRNAGPAVCLERHDVLAIDALD